MALNGGDSSQMSGSAIALFVNCETQSEVDRLWEKLSEGGEKIQCGWVKDKYGFSWNIVPIGLSDLIGGPDPVKSQRAMNAMLQMEKLDIDELRHAYNAG
jgi:predicted 3-demethylubiquinone-9 3-methyltransferase (glyoxalase superfamily)